MADSSKSEDLLARTATAPASDDSGSSLAPPLGETLGRYRLEDVLGEGGMGVVHAAFDPDLERRVALKVLRTTGGSGEARQRLLREARAMARLTHPNVVTVHEVGSANGRDYVAMELVEGQTLAEWLRAEKRSKLEILDAFRAAARGLGAAHSAGLVHRDFKPHNVLRRSDGRICVTDFGLARGVEVSAFEPTQQVPIVRASMNRPSASSLSGLTATGSVLGTPAYMAPEQWSGGHIGPAADQFAFCVGVWEAFTGQRPFRGATLDELKAEVARGPKKEEIKRLPRRLRGVLVRGLDPDPAKRWRSMDDLLAAITRAERRPWLAIGAGGGAALAALAVTVALGRGEANPCAAPRLDPDIVWSPERQHALEQAHQSDGAAAIAADFAAWRQGRATACRAEPVARAARLECFDGVLANLDLQARALAKAKGANVDVGPLLVDPKVCEAARTPRLVAAASEARVDVVAALLAGSVSDRPTEVSEAEKMIARAGEDPCAAVIARLAAAGTRHTTSERRRDLEEADGAAQRCGDDHLSALVAYQQAGTAVSEREPDFAAKLKRAIAAAENVMQPDLQAMLDELRAQLAQRDDRLDEAVALWEYARDGYAKRPRLRAELRADLMLSQLRQLRARPAEIAAIGGNLAEWRARAVKAFGEGDQLVREIDRVITDWQFSLGDVDAFHKRVLALHKDEPLDHKVAVSGRVVDEHGAPAAGVTVAASSTLTADSIGLIPRPDSRSTTTGADGTFQLAEAPADGSVVAVRGELRSPAVKVGEHVDLQLAPTGHVEGKVDLRGQAPTSVVVIAHDPAHLVGGLSVIAPVRADGSFSLDGVPRGKLMLHVEAARASSSVLTGTPVDVGPDGARDVMLSVTTSKRVIYVIVRSTANISLTQGAVFVMPGQFAPPNVASLINGVQDLQQREALPIEGEHAPAAVLAKAKPGDVYAVVPEAPEQLATACAIGLPSEVDRDEQQKIAAHLDRIETRCKTVDPADEVVVIEVPPWPRLD